MARKFGRRAMLAGRLIELTKLSRLLKTVPDGEPVAILMPEGELNVELARGIRLAALTLQGSNWSDPETQQMLETLAGDR
jgi:hypothetical protein